MQKINGSNCDIYTENIVKETNTQEDKRKHKQ